MASVCVKAGICFAVLSLTACVACRPAGDSQTTINDASKQQATIAAHPPVPSDVVPGEYIVTMKAGEGTDAVRQAFAAEKLVAVKSLGGNRYLLTFAVDPGPETVQRRASDSGRIESAQPNFRYRTLK